MSNPYGLSNRAELISSIIEDYFNSTDIASFEKDIDYHSRKLGNLLDDELNKDTEE